MASENLQFRQLHEKEHQRVNYFGDFEHSEEVHFHPFPGIKRPRVASGGQIRGQVVQFRQNSY